MDLMGLVCLMYVVGSLVCLVGCCCLLRCCRLLDRLLGLMCLMGVVGNLMNLMSSSLVRQVSLVCRLMGLVSSRLMLLRLVRLVGLLSLVGRVTLMCLSVVLEGLVSLMRLMGLMCRMALVGHDGIVVHRLTHGLVSVHHRRRLLSGRSRPLPRLDDGTGHMALRASSLSVANIAVDGGLVEEVVTVRSLRRLLGSVGLLLVWRSRVRHGRGLILRRSMGWLKGSRAPEANLGERQARMGGGSRLPQGRHDGRATTMAESREPGVRDLEVSEARKGNKDDDGEILLVALRFRNPSDGDDGLAVRCDHTGNPRG